MPARSERAAIARETLKILENGWYRAMDRTRVEIGPLVRAAVENSILLRPGVLERMLERVLVHSRNGEGSRAWPGRGRDANRVSRGDTGAKDGAGNAGYTCGGQRGRDNLGCRDSTTIFEVTNESTVSVILRVAPLAFPNLIPGKGDNDGESIVAGIAPEFYRNGASSAGFNGVWPRSRVLALNMASAKNPGGGFLSGAGAQEESLARATALFPCISGRRTREMYEHNRKNPRHGLYSDYMILSPDVPVFRDERDRLIPRPRLASILTAPAVNAGAVKAGCPNLVKEIVPVMEARTGKMLAAALSHGYDTLVLGAWGCGVFKNDSRIVASIFRKNLVDGPFRNMFRKVIFAVLDKTPNGRNITPFSEAFDPATIHSQPPPRDSKA